MFGISADKLSAQKKFKEKYDLPYSLLADEDKSVAIKYGVLKEKSMYGRKYWGIERSTFVIDQAGKLKAIFRKVKVDGHADDVLAALKA